MRRLLVAAVGGFGMVASAGLGAQVSVRLTLEEAITRGVEASHRLAEVDARRQASEAAADERRAEGRPKVSLQAGYTRTNHIDEFSVIDPTSTTPVVLYGDVPDNMRTRLDLQWPIYTGGRTDALERAARADAQAIGQERAAAQADLKLEISRAYWALVTAGATARVLEQAVARMDAHLADARTRQRAGVAPPTEVLSTEAQRSRQQMLLIEARNLQEGARADLRRLVGLPADAALEVDPTLTPPVAPQATAAELAKQATTDRPERRAFEFRLQGVDEQRTAAQTLRRPSLFLAGGYDYARPNANIFPRVPEWRISWDVSVNMTWSLWDGGRVKAQLAQATANRHAVEAGLREFDAALDADIRQQRLALDSALAAIAAAEDAVRSATEARRVMAQRYTAGIATNTDALDAQAALVQAELDRTRTVANALLVSARLNRLLGR